MLPRVQLLKGILNIQINIIVCFCHMSNFINPPLFSKCFSVVFFFFNLTCFADSVSHKSMITITKALMGTRVLSWPLGLFSQDVAFLLLL